MAQMVATFRKILYFCSVKSFKRYEAAAKSSVFCIQNLLVKYSRKEWVAVMPQGFCLYEPDNSDSGILFNVKYI